MKKKIDKAKIFDYFSKKAKITSYRVFRRTRDYKLFGVNIIIDEKEMCLRHNLFIADFRCKNDIHFEYRVYKAKDFPRKFKEAIIDSCIELNENVLAKMHISMPPYAVVFIPKASSLEELAIKIDLEK